MKKVIAVLILIVALCFVIVNKISYFYGGSLLLFICTNIFSAFLIIFAVIIFFNMKTGKTVYLFSAAALIILTLIFTFLI